MLCYVLCLSYLGFVVSSVCLSRVGYGTLCNFYKITNNFVHYFIIIYQGPSQLFGESLGDFNFRQTVQSADSNSKGFYMAMILITLIFLGPTWYQ